MARAKRTDRADARRRYRATLVDDPQQTDLDDDSEPAAESSPTPSSAGRSRIRAAAPASSGRPARPGVMGAFRAAFRPSDIRGDLRVLPGLLRHRSFLIPFAMIVGAAAVIAVTGGTEPVSRLLSPYFLAPPPVAPVFLAGFLAPRASWLIGGLLGMVSSIAIVGILSSPAMQGAAAGASGATGATTLQPDILAYSFVVATVGGAFYAAAAAWYKRFLALASPSRGVRTTNRTTGKPTDRSRRRGSDDRPILARRR